MTCFALGFVVFVSSRPLRMRRCGRLIRVESNFAEMSADWPRRRESTLISKAACEAIESNTHFRPEGYKDIPPTARARDERHRRRRQGRHRRLHRRTQIPDERRQAQKPVWAITPAATGSVSPRVAPNHQKLNPANRQTRRRNLATTPAGGAKKSGADTPRLAARFTSRHDEILSWRRRRQSRPLGSHRPTRNQGDYPHNGLAGFAFDALGWMFRVRRKPGGRLQAHRHRRMVTHLGGWRRRKHLSLPAGWNETRTGLRPVSGIRMRTVSTPFGRPVLRRQRSRQPTPVRTDCTSSQEATTAINFHQRRKADCIRSPVGTAKIPGTLPMVAGTGEALSGILAYESDRLPEDYIGNHSPELWG